MEREHNHAQLGGGALDFFKMGELFFRGAEISAEWTLVGTIMKTKFEYSNGCSFPMNLILKKITQIELLSHWVIFHPMDAAGSVACDSEPSGRS